MNIRPLEITDIGRCIELGARFHRESRFGFLPFDGRRVAGFAHHVLKNEEDRYCAFVAEHDGDVFGFIVAELQEYFFSDEKFTEDILFFVDRGRRGTKAAVLLLNAYKAWSASTPAREMIQTIASGIDADKTGRFLEKAGMENIGGIYTMRLK